MSFAVLALIAAVAVLGPVLALPRDLYLPVVFGELAAGIAIGDTGLGIIHPQEPTLAFLASIGFALVMFVAGTHVPVRDRRLHASLRTGAVRAALVGIVAVPVAVLLASAFATDDSPLYAVLLASSSAALVLPVIDSLRLAGTSVLDLLAQVAVADAVCIVALPIAIDPAHAGRTSLGAAAVLAATALVYLGLRRLDRSGALRRLHRLSQRRKFALELRTNLVILFTLAALAVATRVSIMLAGFAFGLAVAAVGQPRRLARQLFALTEGFLGPLFFVWLGASLDIRGLGRHPSFIALGAALGLAAVAIHATMGLVGQPLPMSGLAAAQLGLPVAAATIGTQLNLLAAGEPAALILGAMITIVVAIGSGAITARAQARSAGVSTDDPAQRPA